MDCKYYFCYDNLKKYSFSLRLLSLQVWLNSSVLGVEVGHINNQVLQNEHMAQWGDEWWLGKVGVDFSDTGQWVKSVTVHGAWAADTFSAGSSERKGWVEVVFNVNQGVKVHGWNFLQIDVIADVFGFVFWVFGVVFIDQESLHGCLLFCSKAWIMLLNVVWIQISLDCGCHTLEKYWSFRRVLRRKLPAVELAQCFCYVSDHMSKYTIQFYYQKLQ